MTKNQTQLKPALTIMGCVVVIACLLLAVVLAGRFFDPQIGGVIRYIMSGLNGTSEVTQVNPVTPASISVPESKFNTMGDPNAPVKMVEYADFQCPFCQRYWKETEPQIIKAYVATGKVYFEYRSVGAFIGPDSASAAEAAYCAGDQDRFWEYHDVLYSNWTGENVGDFTVDKLRQYALTVGLEPKTFDNCLTQEKYARQIQQDVSNAKADGIRSTPSFLINNKLVEGAQPFNEFQKAIEAALKGN